MLATKSFTAKLAMLLMTALRSCSAASTSGSRAGARAPPTRSRRCSRDGGATRSAGIADRIHRREHLYVIGRGPSYPMALEAALKIKEVSYIHAEGFAGGELKHGVIALIEPGTPCLVLAPRRRDVPRDRLGRAGDQGARRRTIIGISPEPERRLGRPHPGRRRRRGAAIVNAVPPQLLGYELALLRGHDPDKPRNLAKSVTVK